MESPPLTAGPRFPLYDPRDERDACGTGVVADVSGHRSHREIEQQILGEGSRDFYIPSLSHRLRRLIDVRASRRPRSRRG